MSPSLSSPSPRPVTLQKDLARSIRQGHPWVYRDALRAPSSLRNGALVEIRTRDDRPLAVGYWDAEGPIAVRVLDRRAPHDVAGLVRARLALALSRRTSQLDAATTNTFRWVHGEADALPGIHVDVYADVATIRFDGAGARAFYQDLPLHLRHVADALPIRRVIDRAHRGAGEPPVEVRENGIRFVVDLAQGQKGGLFLDQRENRQEIRARARGLSVLNLFGYTGGFSLYAAAGGARCTDTVDLARPAIEAARRNFQLNDFNLNDASFHAVDAFDFLTAAAERGQVWDIVISDPPSFAPSKRALPAARRAYRRLHQLCARVVVKGGLFCPASCSSHFPREEFLTSVFDGVASAGRSFELESLRGAGFDHPVVPAFPEGNYLKFAIGRLT